MATSDLEPLLRGAANDAERSLLDSAKDDGAAPGAREKMLAALGVPVAPAPERLIDRLGRIVRNTGASYVHGVMLALFVGALAGAALTFARSTEDAPKRDDEPTPAALVPDAPSPVKTEPRTDDALTGVPGVTPESLPSAPTLAASPPTKTAGASASAPPSSDTLAREIARVEAARLALERSEPANALRLLDAYGRDFPQGAFAIEVSVLRIEALARAGRTDEARRLGQHFLEEHRQGAFARRVTATLAAMPDANAAAAADSSDE